MNNSIYKEEILEHYKDPQNFGKLDDFSRTAKLTNPLCGDDIEMYVLIEAGKVKDISFEGKGCAISIASASLLTETVKENFLSDLKELKEEDMLSLLKIEISETRKKCAFLPLAVLRESLNNYK